MDPLLLAYFTFTAILVLTPGSTTAVVVSNTLAGGRRAGLATAAGAALGNTSHAAAAALGLSVVLARWPSALTLLRIGGALYLAWLGLVSIYRVARHVDGGLVLGDGSRHSGAAGATHLPSLRQGLTVNLLNPTVATFYLVVVPSFLPRNAPPWYFAALAALHITMAFAYHGVWALGLHTLRHWLHAPRARRGLQALTAVALLGLSVRILLGA